MPAVGLVLMPRWLYSLLLRLALPVAATWFLWRGWRHAGYRGSLRERLALRLAARADRPIWLHAASVGEVQALAPLLRLLATDGLPLLLTVGTPTGLARARALYADLCVTRLPQGAALLTLQSAPWDLPGAARRFMQAAVPAVGVFVETELWPNLVAVARQQAVPLALVSARVSARSLARYRRLAPALMRATVRGFALIGAQSEADRARFMQLGAGADQVSVTGNLKFDLSLPADIQAAGAALRARWAKDRWLWVAGSTHPEEEAQCLAAHRALLEQARLAGLATPLLVLAPRRPERFDEVASWLEAQPLRSVRLSDAAQQTDITRNEPAPQVLLLDQMGALLAWYAAADAAFVGGTLVPVGGHNLVEPALLGRPVLAGPHTFQAPDIARLLVQAGGLQVARSGAELGAMLGALQADADLARRQGTQAAAAVEGGRGASERARQLVAALPAKR